LIIAAAAARQASAQLFMQIQVQQFLSELATPAALLDRLRKH